MTLIPIQQISRVFIPHQMNIKSNSYYKQYIVTSKYMQSQAAVVETNETVS